MQGSLLVYENLARVISGYREALPIMDRSWGGKTKLRNTQSWVQENYIRQPRGKEV
jgi:hypothetical protein